MSNISLPLSVDRPRPKINSSSFHTYPTNSDSAANAKNDFASLLLSELLSMEENGYSTDNLSSGLNTAALLLDASQPMNENGGGNSSTNLTDSIQAYLNTLPGLLNAEDSLNAATEDSSLYGLDTSVMSTNLDPLSNSIDNLEMASNPLSEISNENLWADIEESLLANESTGHTASTAIPSNGAAISNLLNSSNPIPANDSLDSSVSVASIQKAIQAAADMYNVPANLIQAVIEQESGMNPTAVSSAGALGLMQLMPSTAAAMGVENPLNPQQNIFGGTKYLSQLLQQYHGNTALALAAYNAGPGAVDSYGGIPPFPETQNYVANILQKL